MDHSKVKDRKVLIAHNELILCRLFRDLIAQGEFCGVDSITIANSPQEASEYLKEKEYGLVLCQVGWNKDFAGPVVGAIAEQGGRDKFRLVLVTGGGEDFAAQSAKELGADAWLSVPVGSKEFYEAIKAVLG